MYRFLIWLALCLPIALASAQPSTISFTAEEQAYIARAESIKMCVDPDWMPFERINEQGQHEGISADLVQLVAQRVGLRIELLQLKTWDEMLAASKAGHCQIMSFLNRTPARDQWLIFTDPIFYDPNILITREEHAYVGDLRGVQQQIVALPRGTSIEERLRRDYPNLSIILTGNEQEAIAKVSNRTADMTVRSLIVAAYTIKKEGLFNLKVAGQIPEYTNQLRIGVLKGEPLLRDILDKGVRTITPQEREAISNKHVAINVQSRIDYTPVLQVAGGAALLLLLAFMWNRKLADYSRRLEQLNLELERLSVTDKLTGLYNRVRLDAVLNGEIDRAARSGQPFGIILLDIDHFKQVNDEHGHQVGDQVLQGVAGLLAGNTRKVDTVGRWGGEEFLIICPHVDMEGIAQLAEKLRQAIAGHNFPVVGQKTASFGVCTYWPDDHANSLVARADAALYAAKHKGRNRVEVL
jgi:diguanylate cyclase (GGDEF)-like protein